MTYNETLEWMFAQLPMYQQKGEVAYKNKLDNIVNFTEILGNPEKKFKSIHVAGTNGKGSSSHMLASILQEAGFKVGLYTSPHLKDFRERIKINGKPVPKKFVIEFIAQHRPFLEYHKLSFFEMTVGMAFDYFAKENIDIAIIEVGLGGRLDSTNIIMPEVSLITNIGLDHTHILGDSIEKIAMEKAGIIKRNVPLVISERQRETELIFTLIARQRRSNIVFSDELEIADYPSDLLGDYQKQNIRGVVACLRQLQEFEVTEKHIKKGLKNVVSNTGILGRWQILQSKPTVICDTAHNKEGLYWVLQQLKNQKYEKLHLVLGFVNDKEIENLLDLFPKDAQYYFVKPNVPRGMEVEKILEMASLLHLKGSGYKSVNKGFKDALHNASGNDLIFVGGSTFVVAEII
ncbi:bifunctional folylpolyglutamate synthase/dihydrofolate synthase [Flagellimonas nanhaiensis]|uniref:Dihydrofolate synthase/folylpolyglutamate synthase n=1 Tax=Flagellimonas nanhaiensis TaxID=2292706 RepID=A0A371JS13_9FLAO|nr:folylpolyglutamate synthase/dihydrofolate synthase family protein [Allomuricauda nanhaiensis]RDY60611.1 bifunctional folylpolyglutamate synthase/dihydrofolate synthase [Allomuricauda nanhaiensis]